MSDALPEGYNENNGIPNITDPAPALFADLTLKQAMDKYVSVQTVFQSKCDLHSFLGKLSSHYMFGISSQGQRFVCKNGHERKSKKDPSSNTIRSRAPSLKIGCGWYVSFTGTVRSVKGNDSRAQYDFTLPVRVTGCNCDHNHDLSKQNMVAVFKRSGDLFQNLSSHAMFYLCNMLEHTPQVEGGLLRSVLSNCYPGAFKWSAMQVCNLRLCVLTRLKKMPANTKKNYEDFVAKFPNKTFLQGINLDEMDCTDTSVMQQIWKDSMNTKSETGKVMIPEILASMEKLIPGFDFRCAFDKDNNLVSFVWQTEVMRANLYLYGKKQSLDFMLSETNDLLWPYTAASLRRENNKLCLGCEAFGIGERTEISAFVTKAMYEMSPLSSPDEVEVVYADGKLDKSKVNNELGMPNAEFVSDLWHLTNSKYRKDFGYHYSTLQPLISNMLYSRSPETYEENRLLALNALPREQKYLDHFNNIVADKRLNAFHIIAQYPSSLGKVSSSPAEQNHSSVHAWLGKKYMNSIETVFKDLYFRHLQRVAMWDQDLCRDFHKLVAIKNKETNPILKAATDHFNPSGYDKFVIEYHQSKFYEFIETDDDFSVRRIDSTAMPRIIMKKDLSCSCSTYVAYDFVHCRHIQCIFKNVDFTRVSRRWMKRKSVESVTSELKILMHAHMAKSIPESDGKNSLVLLTSCIHTVLSHHITFE